MRITNYYFKVLLILITCLVVTTQSWGSDNHKLSPIVVSENGRFLQLETGEPFFYLGDTAWELFHRLTREEAEFYLTTRAKQGFNVIQAVALAELDGLGSPNAYGDLPFINRDPSNIAVTDGDNNDYWDHVDYIVDLANELGMYVSLLPTWGSYWNDGTPLFNEDNARDYGRFIGERYKDRGVIWVLGGDRPADTPQKVNVMRAMAEGIGQSGAKQIMTFHPSGGCGSADWLHNELWLDFNMRQNGHEVNYTGRYSNTLRDYNYTPIKPVMDAEPVYEDHPIRFNPNGEGHSTAADVRRAIYWDLFDGAFGHTYGHHSVWQMYDLEKQHTPINLPLMSWQEALFQKGATQMVYGKRLIESRPFFSRIPDPSLIVASQVASAVPGEGRYRFVATRDDIGSYAMVYVPVGRKFSINTSSLRGEKLKCWWYNPRDGKATSIGVFEKREIMEFISPNPGENLDWILVIDDAKAKYRSPGSIKNK